MTLFQTIDLILQLAGAVSLVASIAGALLRPWFPRVAGALSAVGVDLGALARHTKGRA